MLACITSRITFVSVWVIFFDVFIVTTWHNPNFTENCAKNRNKIKKINKQSNRILHCGLDFYPRCFDTIYLNSLIFSFKFSLR